MKPPETFSAWSEDFALAYQVVGGGPVDLVYVEGYASHVDMNWESPCFARFLSGLASHARLIVTDRRGYGCSDRFSPPDLPPIETTVDDLLAVMDAVHVPTLVLADSDGDELSTPENARYVAGKIPGAELVELRPRECRAPVVSGR